MEKYKHILGRWLTMGQDLSIVRRGGPSILLVVLHLIAPGTNGEALQCFWMNQHLSYLLQREHVAKSDGENYIYIILLLVFEYVFLVFDVLFPQWIVPADYKGCWCYV